jgi:peptidyl-tRNA hydrolase, PTH2 family
MPGKLGTKARTCFVEFGAKTAGKPHRPTKQAIVIRRDLKMRRGKEIAQGSHASMAFLTRRLEPNDLGFKIELSEAEVVWLDSSFVKVTLQVQTEEELLEVYEKAKAAGLEAHLITDSGKTEFNGVPMNTAVAIGPDWSEKIDEITGTLKLY